MRGKVCRINQGNQTKFLVTKEIRIIELLKLGAWYT